MDINHVLNTYDNMFGKNTLEEIYDFLENSIHLAYAEQDYSSAITLLNEIIGFCRDTSKKEECLRYCNQVMNLMKQLNIGGNTGYATTLLNIANACRAFCIFEKSLEYYKRAELIYKDILPEGNFLYAGLYNNWSILYQEMGDYMNARDMIRRALLIVDKYPEAVIEQATTRTNLAQTYMSIINEDKTGEYKKKYYNKVLEYLKEADEIHRKAGGKDFHYSSVLSAFGDAFYINGEYEKSAGYYEIAMKELQKHVGKSDAYRKVMENYKKAKEQIIPSHLEKCRAFYEKYGVTMIHDKFPEYENRIAAGLVGEGSECFGYDDDISKDHDFGIGFCMWVTKEDYDKIGSNLQKEYEKILKTASESWEEEEGIKQYLGKRRGVFIIENFYDNMLKFNNSIINKKVSFTNNTWLKVSESNLAASINGKVFRDDSGIFSLIREQIKSYYPKKVWYLRLAEQIHIFSQNGQYNYGRMMARSDYLTADICVSQAVKAAMSIVYLLNRTYAPYYKWMRKGMNDLNILSDTGDILDKLSDIENQKSAWDKHTYSSRSINRNDKKVVIFEEIAEKILKELNHQGIVNGTNTFLDMYCNEIAGKGNFEDER